VEANKNHAIFWPPPPPAAHEVRAHQTWHGDRGGQYQLCTLNTLLHLMYSPL